jgi:hypothetical protein
MDAWAGRGRLEGPDAGELGGLAAPRSELAQPGGADGDAAGAGGACLPPGAVVGNGKPRWASQASGLSAPAP